MITMSLRLQQPCLREADLILRTAVYVLVDWGTWNWTCSYWSVASITCAWEAEDLQFYCAESFARIKLRLEYRIALLLWPWSILMLSALYLGLRAMRSSQEDILEGSKKDTRFWDVIV